MILLYISNLKQHIPMASWNSAHFQCNKYKCHHFRHSNAQWVRDRQRNLDKGFEMPAVRVLLNLKFRFIKNPEQSARCARAPIDNKLHSLFFLFSPWFLHPATGAGPDQSVHRQSAAVLQRERRRGPARPVRPSHLHAHLTRYFRTK